MSALKRQLRISKVIYRSVTYMRADWGVLREAWSWAHWEVHPCSPYFPPYPALPAPAALPTVHPNRPQQIWGIPFLHNDQYLFCTKNFKLKTFTSSYTSPKGLEIASLISWARSCCSVMSCIMSSILSMLLIKKKRGEYVKKQKIHSCTEMAKHLF